MCGEGKGQESNLDALKVQSSSREESVIHSILLLLLLLLLLFDRIMNLKKRNKAYSHTSEKNISASYGRKIVIYHKCNLPEVNYYSHGIAFT